MWPLSVSRGKHEKLQVERDSYGPMSCLVLLETGSQPGRTAPRRRVCWWWMTWCTWLTSETAGYAGVLAAPAGWMCCPHRAPVLLQAVLCRMEESGEAGGQKKWSTLALSKEHNPTIYEERMRIQRAGGTVR